MRNKVPDQIMKIQLFAVFTFLASYKFFIVNSLEFSQTHVGISFSPYVKTTSHPKTNLCPNDITLNELRAMLQVVATKFSRISTETVGAWNETYVSNHTYFQHSCIIARTAEVAAIINKENENLTLSVLIGVMANNDSGSAIQRTNTEILVALEAEKIANEIYPGTVEGFQMYLNAKAINNTELAVTSLAWFRLLKPSARARNLHVGIITHVEDFSVFDIQKYDVFKHFHISKPHVRLVIEADFLNVKVLPSNKMFSNGPNEIFSYFTRLLTSYGPMRKGIHFNFEIAETTGWPSTSESDYLFQSVEQMQAYWIMLNDFASTKKYTIWFYEAFDNPWKESLGQNLSRYGWWRLDENKLANDTTSYIEKIVDKPKKDPRNSLSLPTLVGGGVAVAFAVTVVVVVMIIYFSQKINSLKHVLSYDEIKEFKYGFTDNQASEDYACSSAMKKPYDRTLEIRKDNLEIYWDQFLGCGQFDSVYKALLKGDTPKEVALKTTKIGCPTNALKGLLSEIKILSHLGHHPNVVSIFGAYTAELTKGKAYVALELCEAGSLRNCLTQINPETSIDSVHENLMRWSFEIASGMEHIGKMGVIHADLATRNVLLTNEYTAKISDFGLSRRLYDYSEYIKKQEELIPYKWMAIESLRLKKFSYQSNVWSFGVTLWEIFSLGAEPYPGYTFNANFIESVEDGSAIMNRPKIATPKMYGRFIVSKKCMKEFPMNLSKNHSASVFSTHFRYQIMLDCWNLRPDMRTSFSDLVIRFSEIINRDYKYDVLFEKNV